MAVNNLSIDREFRYIVQWFNEWSDLERNDFVPVFVNYFIQDNENLHLNGVVNSVADIGIKPMSLFQCRIKLFREWNVKWPLEFKSKLKEKIIEIDPKTGENIISEMNKINKITINGHENNTLEHIEEIESTAAGLPVENGQATLSAAVSGHEEFNTENQIVTVQSNDLVLTNNDNAELAEQVQMPTQELVPAEVSLTA
ncbi:uncharacterized protein LOC119678370 [Teleopsis dalmanni]|uniref:uncharacterized protein LOC119663864 n=1 Tax=Teleopsis dalmanni TaxID=139649 RepID=UPI000D32AEBD|nr:uncharacterized protein LOC119663864 [Teleopsis dalmanni]XP_037946089.1 uncharacterized protein LOC119678370 [Teleopsis dalmanni]